MIPPKAHFNGVRPDGSYLQPPISEQELTARLLAEAPDWHLPPVPDPRGIDDPFRRPIYGVDPNILEESGWAVIFPAGVDGRIKQALQDLLDRREEQAGKKEEWRYRELVYYPGESYTDFMKRYRVPPGLANPDKLPYYLLLIGSPQQIPFEFQLKLDQVYAVGRLHLKNFSDFRNYARTVVASEQRRRHRRTRKIAFFGAKNPGDRTTRRIIEELLQPLSDQLEKSFAAQRGPAWKLRRIFGDEATKARLEHLLGGEETPAVLFTTCHGMAFDTGDARQLDQQGALLCSDWRGEGHEVKPEDYLAAKDIPDDARLEGLITFHFACHGAGTRALDSFLNDQREYDRQAPRSFLARLPQRLLSHPNRGALAVISHVDRAWTSSFSWNDTGQPEIFDSALRCLLDGQPVGAAMEYFSQLQADHATKLDQRWEDRDQLSPRRQAQLARQVLASRDARNYVVLGDPAVRVGI